ncbi:MAG: ATP-dependent zinc protease [Acidimicrobiia bacterium]|nr:ATP-dependent zinc protease [Acidimicrobiia bacterium]
MVPTNSTRRVLGWREWARLDAWCDTPIKAKLDTGAKTSSIHAFGLEISAGRRNGSPASARFEVHPEQDTAAGSTLVEVDLCGYREVRSSNGVIEIRPAVITDLTLGGSTFPIELTLTDRDLMGFRLLVGREAIRRRFLIDADASFLAEANS